MDILEGNKLIAEFMGWRKDDFGFWFGCKKGVHYKLTFDTDWNELIEVVEKIEGLGHKCEIGITSCTFYSASYNVERTYADTKIKAVWYAVIEFIQWYNSNLNQPLK